MTVNDLYKVLDCDATAENPFETLDSKRIFDELFKGLIAPIYEQDWDSGEKFEALAYDLVRAERRQAFAVGYKTALELILSGWYNGLQERNN